jgi:hypothetical protein
MNDQLLCQHVLQVPILCVLQAHEIIADVAGVLECPIGQFIGTVIEETKQIVTDLNVC